LVLILIGITLGLAAQPDARPGEYRTWRSALRDKITDGVVVLFGNTEGAGSESFHVFHQESDFYYLSGWSEPGAILLIAPAAKNQAGRNRSREDDLAQEALFLPPRNQQEEAWTGSQPDPKDPATASRLGFDSAREMRAFESDLRRYAEAYGKIYTLLPDLHDSDEGQAVQQARVDRLKKIAPKAELLDVRRTLGSLRQIKSAHEIELIRRAVDCSIDAHLAAGRAVKPGLFEYEIGALMKYTFERVGCTNTAFDPIVAAGAHAVVLHYTGEEGRMEAGDLVVLDVGSEYGDYSADISRTWPVSGHFTPRQREIYQIVLGAQKAVIDAVRPGVAMYGGGAKSLHQIAYNYLNTHGKDLHGAPLGKYFIHGIGHSVGLDVHDLVSDPALTLAPDMVIAIEPGLYLPEENIGVRIEDNVLVTKDGHEVLTNRLLREPDAIERWMSEHSAAQ
jgi:Xaa-Pro aminopeptidase